MSKQELKEKSKELISLIKKVSDLIKQFDIDLEELSHKKQLKGISRTISNFERRGIPVPTELRDLKTSLVNKLSESEDINNIKVEIYSEIEKCFPDIPKNHKRRIIRIDPANQNRTKSSIKLIDLINAGLIEPNTKIFHKSKRFSYDGTIMKNGQVSVFINSENQIFDSLSAAAISLKNRSINGWAFWKITRNGKDIKLNEIRNEYSENYNKTL